MWLLTPEVAPGMVLAAPVKDGRGILLIPAGTCLEDRHVRLLDRAGINGVHVEDLAAPDDDPALAKARWDSMASRLAPRFRLADRGHPVTAAVFDYCVRRELRNAREGT